MRTYNESNFAALLVRRLGEHSCLIDAPTGHSVRGQEITESIVGFAAGFLSAGLRPGERVVIGCDLSPSSTLAYLGAMYAGIVPVLVDERLFAMKGRLLLATSRAKAMWTAKSLGHGTEGYGGPRIAGTFPPRPPDSLKPAAVAEGDAAVLLPTSGSTGVPRLVVVSHANLRANTEAIIRSQSLAPDDRGMLIMPVSYCFGASLVQSHLYQGGGVVFDSRFMFPDKVLRAIDTYGCTSFAGVPAVYNILLRRSNLRSLPLRSLRRFLQAGGSLSVESVREICRIVPTADFFVMYGQTEATARISCFSVRSSYEKLGSVGRPLDNLVVRVVDERGRELSNGEIGEIQVQGPSVCSQYLDDPEATEAKFGGGWLKTGDLGCMDHDGWLWIRGRIGDFIKIRGFRVGVREVEETVAAVPGVYECAAVGVRHPEAGEALALFIVPDEGASGLAEKVRQAVPSQWTCASVKVVSQLPKTYNGKVARSELMALV